MATIHLIGNPDLPSDSLPVRMKAALAARFPDITFRETDPNELDLPAEGSETILIDTVSGLRDVRFVSSDEIAAGKARVTAHDFDLGAWILLVKKVRTKSDIRILGIPMHTSYEAVLPAVIRLLSS